MTTLQNTPRVTIEEIKAFSYPRLYTGKEWYIGFNVYDPDTQKMRRKKIKLNYIKKKTDRRKYADGLMKRLINRLERGWNPFIKDQIAENRDTTFKEACDIYRKHINILLEKKILRIDTHRSYESQLRNIEAWNERRIIPIVYTYQFDRAFISEFLDYIFEDLKRTATTRNNYLTFCSNFCQFLVDKQFARIKATDGIAPISKRKIKKVRKVIDESDLTRLFDYLQVNNRHYLLACYILHYCFVRRKEMSYIQLKHFNIKEQTLFVPGDISKNGEDAIVTLPEKVIMLMLDLQVFENPESYYLFSEGFRPGRIRKVEKQFTDYWSYHIRKDLKFPMNYQFYSLKDTGITDMLQKYDVLTVRDQARHSDISITNKYTPKSATKANKALKKHEGKL